jgi:NAD(P)-dependent dehydrogenase (short-subunit alcohol dehydrogenase family)
MSRLNGKVAVVTGGASGMGAATVRRFVAEGADVLATDINVEQGEAAAREAGAIFQRQDVASPDDWAVVMRTIEEKFGRLDIVMNNAGIVVRKNIEEVDLETWNRIIGINLTGVMLGCQNGIRLMRRNPDGAKGSLINIASTTAHVANPVDPGYTAAKSGVRMLTKSVATHCARAGTQIRCNSISPGVIATGITMGYATGRPDLVERYKRMSPLARMGSGDDIAGMAVYLASDDAAYVTGADMVVDGGMLAIHPGF